MSALKEWLVVALRLRLRLRSWVEIQTAKFKFMNFAKSKEQAFGAVFLASEAKFRFFSDLSFLKLIIYPPSMQ